MTPTITLHQPDTPTKQPFRHQFHPVRIGLAFAMLGAAGWVAHHHDIGLWTLAIGVLGPDLSFLAAIGAPNPHHAELPPRAVRAYNAVHHPAAPIALTLAGVVLHAPIAIVVGLAWRSHLAWDRGLGYNLRNPDGSIRS